MARPIKVGLEYFPLDCQMDDKILMLEAEHGMEGFGVYIRLLQYCYQIEDGKLDMSIVFRWKTLGKTLGILPENLRKMVDTMLEIDLFDREVFEKEQKLTSNGIQKRLSKVATLRQKERLRKAEGELGEQKEFSRGKPDNSGRKSTQKERDTNVSQKGNSPKESGGVPPASVKAVKNKSVSFIFPASWTPSMIRAYQEDWLPFRQSRKEKLQPVSVQKQIDSLAHLPERALIACLNHSISNGYQGLFPERFHSATAPSANRRPINHHVVPD